MSTEFKWTPDLLAEFIQLYVLKTTDGEKLINQFKASKQPKPEWEITQYRHKPTAVVVNNNSHYWENAKNGDIDYEIYSVKRLSDQEWFNIGDEISMNTFNYKIDHFQVIDTSLYLNDKKGTGWNINGVNKTKQVLFTTEDGIPVMQGDRVWYVTKSYIVGSYDFIDMGNREVDLRHYPDQYKYFSTAALAEEYAFMNKELFSINEIIELGNITRGTDDVYIKKFIQKAKNKLNV